MSKVPLRDEGSVCKVGTRKEKHNRQDARLRFISCADAPDFQPLFLIIAQDMH